MTAPEGISDRIMVETIVKSATCAPSLHNSQPWRFVAPAAPEPGTEHVDLFAARERAAFVVDPHERELHIGCGAAIELGRVAARSLGRDATVALLPEAGNPDHLARLSFGVPYTPDERDVRLAESISLRYTERSRFEDRMVDPEDIAALRASVTLDGTWLRILEKTDDQLELYVLLDRADDLERSDPRYLEELARWVHEDGSADEGIPEAAIGEPASGRASSLRLRDFRPDAEASQQSTGATADELPPPPEHPLVAVIGTDDDSARAWLQAGRALGSLLLEAASRNIAASPMTQVLEVPATRTMLTHALGLIGYPQMLLRMGYASGHPATPRRSLAEVLRYE